VTAGAGRLPPATAAEIERRRAWAEQRRQMEETGRQMSPHGPKRRGRVHKTELVAALLRPLLPLAGLGGRARANALDVRLVRHRFDFPALPAAFDGYRILQLSDLHLGSGADVLAPLGRLLDGLEIDLVALTGDYRFGYSMPAAPTLRPLLHLLGGLRPRDGIAAVLGNHDSHDMLPLLEAGGVRVLANETLALRRGEATLSLTGLDDVHSFLTEAARAELARAHPGFRVALVHSPELADEAAAAGIRLQLSGHTHGGQICPPGGRPVVTQLCRLTQLAAGPWRYEGLQGVTSRGVGHSGLPARFNCPAEAELIVLRRGGA